MMPPWACRRCARALWVMPCALWVLLCAPAASPAQSTWDLDPYRVRLAVSADDAPECTPRLLADLADALSRQAVTVYGAMWDASAEVVPRGVAVAALSPGPPPAMDALPEDWAGDDKVVVVHLGVGPAGYHLATRELDVATQTWSTAGAADVAQTGALPSEAFRLVMAGHAPLALIESVEGKQAVLRLRAGSLPPRDADLQPATPTTIFQPITRVNRADGVARSITPVEWTLLYPAVEQVSGAELPCQIISGLRSPISGRRRGKTRQLALAVVPSEAPTRLVLTSRSNALRPLVGYEVFSHPPDSPTTIPLGRTGTDGSLLIEPTEAPLSAMRVLLVRNGGDVLARLPLVPGARDVAPAVLADDDERLAVEGFITGLQEELVDTFATRALLIARIRARLQAGEQEAAGQLLDQIRRLRTRDQFQALLNERKKTVITSDPLVQKQIERLFTDTAKVIDTFLDTKPTREIEAEVAAAAGTPPAS
jgi:hypothetical protein